jgi:hypothetical protein
MALGLRVPVSRRCLRYRLIVAGETAKVLTMSARGMPVSTARSTRSLRSCEYGFMLFCFPALLSLHTPFFMLPLSSIFMQVAVGSSALRITPLDQQLCPDDKA